MWRRIAQIVCVAVAVMYGVTAACADDDQEKNLSGIPIFKSDAAERIQQVLNEPTELEFIETGLDDVVMFFKSQHKIEIQLDKRALKEAGIGADTFISGNLKGVSLRSALRMVLGQLGLAYVIRDEVLLITTKEQADATLEVRIYPVRDLLWMPGVDASTTDPDYESLIDTISSCLTPHTWVCVGGSGSIKHLPTTCCLVINQTREVHDGVDGLLATLRLGRAKQAE